MAGSQTLRFDIVGDSSSASRAFKDTAASAALAARGAKQAADSFTIQSKSAQASAAATVSLAKSDDLLRDAQLALAGSADDASGSLGGLKLRLDELNGKVAAARVSLDGDKEAQAQLDAIDARLVDLDHKTSTPNLDVQGTAKAVAELSAVDVALDKVGGKGGSAEGASSSLGLLASPMGALVGAGVLLAPVMVTTSVGLAGFGAAAAATIAPILAAGTATKAQQQALAGLDPAQKAAYTSLGQLKAQFGGFTKSLEPEAIGLFGQGLKLAGEGLHDVQPVAAATGKALGVVVGEIGADLKTQQWQQFFGFMAKSAGPDIQQLGGLFVSLMNTMPPLLEDLQPVASGLLTVATDAAQAAGAVAGLVHALPDLQTGLNGVLHGIESHIPAGNENIFQAISGWVDWMGKHVPAGNKSLLQLAASAGGAATGSGDLGAKAAAAAPQVGTLAGDVALLGANTTVAADATKAFDDIWTQLVGKSVSDQQAVLAMSSAFDSYNTSLKTNHANSTVAQQAFLSIITTMGSGLSTLQTNGATIGQLNSFYQANIDKLNTLHNLTPTERKDVQDVTRDYLTWANTTSGLTKQVQAASDTIKTQFLAQIGSIAAHAPGVSGDVSTLANSILKTGNNSSATAADRAKLIADLEQAGVKADAARGLVNKLQGQIDAMHGKSVSVGAVAHGSGAITATENILGEKTQKLGSLTFVAAGGKITGGTPGKDSVLLMGEPGEVMVPKSMVDAGAVDHLRGKLPGFAAGGVVGQGIPDWMGAEGSAFVKGAANAGSGPLLSAFLAAASAAAAAAGAPGSGTAVTRWAPDILQVLGMLRQDSSNLGAVEHRISVESGGNPNAINLWDSNAAAGDPSRGLMQTIGATFARFRSFALPNDIYNPLANIFAGVNYAIQDYPGRSLSSVMLQAGGYANGTSSARPGLALVGERGPELVNFRGGEQVIPHQVIPRGGSGGQVTIVVQNHGVIGSQAEVDQWLHNSIDRLARGSRLTYALQRSPSAAR